MATNDQNNLTYVENRGYPSFDEVNDFHTNSDLDDRLESQHHTLGMDPYQASPGDHTHDGKNSKRIKFSDIDGGIFDIDGGHANSVYGGIPVIDGGNI